MKSRAFIRSAALSAAALLCMAAPASAELKLHALGVYKSDFLGFFAKIVTPCVSGTPADGGREALNAEFASHARKAVENYEKEVAAALKDAPDFSGHLGVVLDYEIKTNNDKILAFDIYEMEIAGSSSTTHKLYNFDNKSGALIELKSLFKPGADYVKAISENVKSQMRAANKRDKNSYWIAPEEKEGFSAIRPDQNFFVNDRGNIVVCFDKYEVAPGSTGSPEFEIPRSAVEPYLAK